MLGGWGRQDVHFLGLQKDSTSGGVPPRVSSGPWPSPAWAQHWAAPWAAPSAEGRSDSYGVLITLSRVIGVARLFVRSRTEYYVVRVLVHFLKFTL